MSASDARPIPRKNVAYRVTFPIYDNDGDLVTGAAGLDSEVSIDGATFADCTNEATEIATSSGVYYLDLTSGEMNGDTVAVIVKTSTTNAKTTVLVFYPEELGDVRVSVGQWNGTAIPSEHTAGYPIVTVKDGTGTGEINTNGGKIVEVETLTGHTAQTGDCYARLGAPAGASVSADIAGVSADVWDTVLDSTFTATEVVRIMAAVIAGESSGGPASPIFKSLDGTTTRVTGTVSSGNRISVSYP